MSFQFLFKVPIIFNAILQIPMMLYWDSNSSQIDSMIYDK